MSAVQSGTFDPTAFYRASASLDVFDRHGLGPAELRAVSVEQTDQIVTRLSESGIPLLSARESALRGGFVALRTASAHELVKRLRARGVHVDARGSAVRLGPAPYLEPAEIERALEIVRSEYQAEALER